MLLVWFAVESLVYRSGAYLRIASSESNTGAVVNSLMMLEAQYQAGRRTVLVLGDSRVAEGFSGPTASAAGDIVFINIAVPGSTPRTWYYLLREINRRGYSVEAVLLAMPSQVPASRLPDWPLSPNQDLPLLGLRDLGSYPRSFDSEVMRRRARQALLFPAMTLRQDTRALLVDPGERWVEITQTRALYLAAVPGYPGRDSRMPELAMSTDRTVTDFGQASAEQRAQIQVLIDDQAKSSDLQTLALNREYLSRWIGKTVRLMQHQGARTLVAALPRAPYPELLTAQPGPPMPELWAGIPGLTSLPEGLLADLEQAQYFFDAIHANRAGREQISSRLGDSVRAALTTN